MVWIESRAMIKDRLDPKSYKKAKVIGKLSYAGIVMAEYQEKSVDCGNLYNDDSGQIFAVMSKENIRLHKRVIKYPMIMRKVIEQS